MESFKPDKEIQTQRFGEGQTTEETPKTQKPAWYEEKQASQKPKEHDPAKPREGKEVGDVVKRFNEIKRMGFEASGFRPVAEDKLPDWARIVLDYYQKIGDRVRYERLKALISSGRLLAGEDHHKVFYGANNYNDLNEKTFQVLIAVNDNSQTGATLIHELNGRTLEENDRAEISFLRWMRAQKIPADQLRVVETSKGYALMRGNDAVVLMGGAVQSTGRKHMNDHERNYYPVVREVESVVQDLRQNGHNLIKIYLPPNGLTDHDTKVVKQIIRTLYNDHRIRTAIVHFAGLHAYHIDPNGVKRYLLFDPNEEIGGKLENRIRVQRSIAKTAEDFRDLGDALAFFQIGNENEYYVPQGSERQFFNDKNNDAINLPPEEYYRFMNTLASVYKRSDPAHLVFLGHGEMYKNQIKDMENNISAFDGLALNLYPNFGYDPDDDSLRGSNMKMAELEEFFKQQFALTSHLNMPVILGEFGESSHGIGEEKQARYYANAVRVLSKFVPGSRESGVDYPKVLLGLVAHEYFPQAWKGKEIHGKEPDLALFRQRVISFGGWIPKPAFTALSREYKNVSEIAKGLTVVPSMFTDVPPVQLKEESKEHKREELASEKLEESIRHRAADFGERLKQGKPRLLQTDAGKFSDPEIADTRKQMTEVKYLIETRQKDLIGIAQAIYDSYIELTENGRKPLANGYNRETKTPGAYNPHLGKVEAHAAAEIQLEGMYNAFRLAAVTGETKYADFGRNLFLRLLEFNPFIVNFLDAQSIVRKAVENTPLNIDGLASWLHKTKLDNKLSYDQIRSAFAEGGFAEERPKEILGEDKPSIFEDKYHVATNSRIYRNLRYIYDYLSTMPEGKVDREFLKTMAYVIERQRMFLKDHVFTSFAEGREPPEYLITATKVEGKVAGESIKTLYKNIFYSF